MAEEKTLSEIRENIELEEAENKLAHLETVYSPEEQKIFLEAIDLISTKVASGELTPMSPSSLVSLAATLTGATIDEANSKTAAAEEEKELEGMYEEASEIIKKAGYDLDEIVESDDEEAIQAAIDYISEVVASENTEE